MNLKGLFNVSCLFVLILTACASPEPASPEAKPVAQVVSTPISPIATPTPPPTPEPTPTVVFEPPLCQFKPANQGRSPEPESLLDQYVFSEPRPVLDYEGILNVIGWLPGDQRLLIARSVPEQNRQTYEVFNIQSNQVKQYGEGLEIGTMNGSNQPIWLNSEQAIAFVDRDADGQDILRISRENGHGEIALTDLDSPFLSPGPNKNRVSFFPGQNRAYPKLFNPATRQTEDIEVKRPSPPRDDRVSGFLGYYQLAWHPQGKTFVYFNNSVFYLADTRDKEVCKIDWGRYGEDRRWVLSAYWSPDGNYLAALTTGAVLPVPFIHLTILDMSTGIHRTWDIESGGNIYAMAWGANNRDILAITQNLTTDTGHNVYIIDTITGNNRQLFQDSEFLFSGDTGVVWSSNGREIALNCYNQDYSRRQLCLSDVEVQ